MRIDGPKGLGAWLQGWFSGSFRGNLEGTASFAETASYVHKQDVDGLEETYLDKVSNKTETVSGQLVLSGSTEYVSRLIVHGGIKVLGNIIEGKDTDATEDGAHAEGFRSKALGVGSHAEGKDTRAIGVGSHAEGSGSKTIGIGSHAEGLGTIAAGDYQHVAGRYNIPDASDKYLFIIGNGTSEESRSNAFAVRADGVLEFGESEMGGGSGGMVVSGSTVVVSNVQADQIEIKSTIDQIGKVRLEYQDSSDSLSFRFLSENQTKN